MKKRCPLIMILFTMVLFGTTAYPLISAGGNIYYGQTGFLYSAGISTEFGFESCFTGESDELTMLGLGLDWIGGEDPISGYWLDGIVVSFSMKEGFLLPPGNMLINVGPGAALVMLGYDLGGAIFAEVGLYWEFVPLLVFCASARGGASFFEDAIAPFAGIRIQLGIIFPNAEPDDYDY